MNFSIDRNALLDALRFVGKGTETRTTIPILRHTRIVASGDSVIFSATDLEIGVVTDCQAVVSKPGSVTLPAKQLAEYVGLLPSGLISFKVDKNNEATLLLNGCKLTIAGMSDENFPTLPQLEDEAFRVTLSPLVEAANRVSVAISTEVSRFTLNAARFELANGSLKMVATDGHRLAIASVAADFAKDATLLVPQGALTRLKLLKGKAATGEVCRVSFDATHVQFVVGNRKLISRLTIGNFPDYQKVIPKKPACTIKANREAIACANGRALSVSGDDRSSRVDFQFGEDSIRVVASDGEQGTFEESVSARIDGKPVNMALNGKFASDFFKNAVGDLVELQLTASDASMVMRLAGGVSGEFDYLLMPLRT